MGKEAFYFYKVFRDTINKLDAALKLLSNRPAWTLAKVITSQTQDVNDPRISQPICTAVQVALVELLKSWGISPKFVVGHSSGRLSLGKCLRWRIPVTYALF